MCQFLFLYSGQQDGKFDKRSGLFIISYDKNSCQVKHEN